MNDRRRRIIGFATITLFLIVTFSAKTPLAKAVTWSLDTQLTTDLAVDRKPSVMQAQDGTVWVVWASDRISYQYDLFYKTSSDNGQSWSPFVRLTTQGGIDEMPSVMQAQDGTVWVVWESQRTGDPEIFRKTSSNNGQSWSRELQLTNSSGEDAAPSITQNVDGRIWVVWHRVEAGNYDIFCKNSSDNGLSWSNGTRLTTHLSFDLCPSITCTRNGTLWVVWASYRTGNFDIFCKTSSDNGLSWSSDTQLTTDVDLDHDPSITQGPDGALWVVWGSDRIGKQTDLYYKTSPDYGLTWSPVTRLTDVSDEDQSPSVTSTDDRKMWVVWESYRTADFEIFYKTSDAIPIHDVAITDVTPSPTEVGKGETLHVSVVAENQGTEDETFEVTCYANSTLIGSQAITLAAGTFETLYFSYDTSGLATGTYVMSANASVVLGETVENMADNVFTDDTVDVILRGDLNDDGIVDMQDMYIVFSAFGTTPGDPYWDPRADLVPIWMLIDFADVMVVVNDFGKT